MFDFLSWFKETNIQAALLGPLFTGLITLFSLPFRSGDAKKSAYLN